MYQSTSWRPVESLTAAAADQHPSPTAYSAEENGSIVEAEQAQFQRGQRVRAIDPDTGKQRNATVVEVDERAAYVRVCFDLKWMHDWLPVAALSLGEVGDSKRPKLVEVTRVGGKRSFMLWGEIYKGYLWHWRNPENSKNIRWVSRHKQQAFRHRLPLGTPVILCNGVQAVISGHSSASASRYRVSYFDRRFWSVRHKWLGRENFEVRASNETATAV